jgi:hypothetical protein
MDIFLKKCYLKHVRRRKNMTISSSKRIVIVKKLKESRSTSRGVLHVIPLKGRWSVEVEGAERAQKILDTKEKAIDYAKKAVTGRSTKYVIVHKKDGTIARHIHPSLDISTSRRRLSVEDADRAGR